MRELLTITFNEHPTSPLELQATDADAMYRETHRSTTSSADQMMAETGKGGQYRRRGRQTLRFVTHTTNMTACRWAR